MDKFLDAFSKLIKSNSAVKGDKLTFLILMMTVQSDGVKLKPNVAINQLLI